MLIGCILPDLVDKVPGRIVFISSLENGRIFFHSLIIVMLFLLTGLIIRKYFRSFAFLVVGFVVLLHQLADLMCTNPVSWYYPFLGPFPVDYTSDYFQQDIFAELTFVTEWIYFAAIMVVSFVLCRNQTFKNTLLHPDHLIQQKIMKFYFCIVGVALFVLSLSVIIIAIWDPLFNF